MKKYLRIFSLTILALVLTAGISKAQTILCVDRDFDDSGAVYTDTWPMISAALDAAGYTYDYHRVLDPGDNGPDAEVMGEYDVVIWFTGEAWTDGETMGPDDEFNLLLYQTLAGGKLLLNAQDYLYDWYGSYGTFNPGEFPYDQLGVVTVEQDVYHIEEGGIADTARFVGSPGSLAEGLVIPVHDIFTTDGDDGLYGDSIAEHNGQALLGIMSPYMSPGPAAIQYETDFFRSIFTTIDVAAISDETMRNILVHRMVDWLMYGATGVSELDPSDVQMVVKPNPVVNMVEIGMMNPMDEISIFNSQGQMVRNETVNQTSAKLDLGNLPTGVYILKARSGEKIITEKIIKQ